MGNPFWGVFDFNFDGHTSRSEQTTGIIIMNQVLSRSRRRQASGSAYSYSDLAEEYVEFDAWRDECEDGSDFGLSPDDYQSKDEYERVLNKAKQLFKEKLSQIKITITPAIEFGFEVECPALDELNAIKRENFANQRSFEAACNLSKIQTGLVLFPDKRVRNYEIRLCRFILQNPTILASRYLTPNSCFLYAQAVKEHFRLPFDIPDEDISPKTTLSHLIEKIAKKEPSLAWKVWHWCVTEFSPYLKFCDYKDELYNDVLSMLYSMPMRHTTSITEYFGAHEDFCEQIFTKNPRLPVRADLFIVAALANNSLQTAQVILVSVLLHPKMGPRSITELVDNIILRCRNKNLVTTMELFREHLYPVIKLLDAGSITRSFSRWESDMNSGIT